MSAFNFKCRECGCEFDRPHTYFERHGFTDGLYERFQVCPRCHSCDYDDANLVESELEDEEVDEC